MTDACDGCLRRAYLIGRLAGSIAGQLGRRRRASGLLALEEDQLITAVAGDAAGDLHAFLDAFDAAAARDELERLSLEAACRHGAGYPEPLLALEDAPTVVFTAGGPGGLHRLIEEPAAVALVGTRNPSPYGLEIAYELGRGLGAAGVTVVSGLALGIDAAAHRGCVEVGGPAVAVLAGGPDVPYPRSNLHLYERIRAQGTIVSELPPGQRVYRWAFPARNRIMAALAAITVVVEAADPSGSLITSAFAADIGRTVAAVPGRVTSRVSAGSNNLLADGARMVTCAEDLLDELFGVGSGGAGAGGAAGRAARAARAAGCAQDPVEERVLDALEAGLGLDGVCADSGLPAREARALLARLETSGRVRRDGLGGYRRTAARG